MPKLQAQCPNCGQPILADVTQTFDVGVEPQAKQILLSGRFNFAQCQACGFQGQLPLPLVYHDPDKEMLLTFVPPDAHRTMEERENLLAPMLKEVTENLPPEKRKGYLFQPKTMLTAQKLIETVLEADGITKEMLEAQEKKMRLVQRLMTADEESQREIIQQDEELIDQEFFGIFSQLAQVALQGGSEDDVEKLRALQDLLLSETEYGREVQKEAEAVEAARESLEELGQGLTREGLLQLVIEAPDMARVRALGSLARPGMDYSFFQMFTGRIEKASGDEREQLVERRNALLKLIEEIDKQVEERTKMAHQNLEALLKAEDIAQALRENINAVDDFFIHALEEAMETAKGEEDTQRLNKLTQVMAVLQELSSPPELEVLEALVEHANDENKLKETIAAHGEKITPRLIEYMTQFLGSAEESLKQLEGEQKKQQIKFQEDLHKVYQAVLQFSMEREMRK
ncbi:MAG: hypothetical protein MAG431_01092 [Chloroflexi bacterium]|nr:hypothetical protein [Chloroflexota bacterium]